LADTPSGINPDARTREEKAKHGIAAIGALRMLSSLTPVTQRPITLSTLTLP